MGVLNMALSVGMMLGPVLAGLLSDIVGLRPLFGFGAVAGGLGTLVFTWLTTEKRLAAGGKRGVSADKASEASPRLID